MYAGIESVKSGYAYDDRYSFKDKYFDCPQTLSYNLKMILLYNNVSIAFKQKKPFVVYYNETIDYASDCERIRSIIL